MNFGYGRISKDDQNAHLQRDALERAGVDRMYLDENISRLTSSRPQLDRMIDALRPGDTVTVWRLDRLGGSLKHLIQLMEQFRELEVEFRSLTEGIDTRTAGGKLLYHVTGAFAEFEVTIIRERTRAGLESARKRGRRGGRRRLLDMKATKRADALYRGSDMTWPEIAEELGVSRSTLAKAIRRLRDYQDMRRSD